LKKTSPRTLGFFTVPTGPTAAIHLKKDDFLSEEWGAPHSATLSKILWHRNINTTMRVYGRNFDESYGTRHVGSWLDQRALRTRLTTGQPDFADLFEEAVEKGVFSENVLLRTYEVLRRRLGFKR
jgi:hypothetical protein